jgi:hypothetical protein
MGEKVKVRFTTFRNHLIEGVSSGMAFGLVSEDFNQCSQFCHCKDYLQDAIWGRVNGKPCSVFGFKYDPDAKHQPTLKRMRVVIANDQDQKFREKIPNVLDFMNQFEAALKMKPTKATECEDPPKQYAKGGVFLLESSKRWLHSPVMVSLYTLLVRVGPAHKIGTPFMETIKAVADGEAKAYSSVDSYRLKSGMKGIERILKLGDQNIFAEDIGENYPANISSSTIHNSSGICSFSDGTTKSYYPNWHRKESK